MKEHLRRQYIQKRKEVSFVRRKESKKKICEKLLELTNGKERVLSYFPLESEVDVSDFNEYLEKENRLYLPKILDESLVPCMITCMEKQLKTFSHAFLEPDNFCEKEEHVDVVIVPGVVFDHYGGRIGFGKGFYDRFLANRSVFSIGVCFSEQVYEKKLILEDHDKNVEHVCIV